MDIDLTIFTYVIKSKISKLGVNKGIRGNNDYYSEDSGLLKPRRSFTPHPK
jgi:hypothetical protein